MKDFFVSYNRADRAWAEWIARELQLAGFSVVSQFADFAAGSNFVLEMDRAAKECERMIAVLSPSYLAASFTQPEWAAYFARDPMGLERKLVPVRVRECEVQGLLGQVVYADLVDRDEAAARSALLAAAGRPASGGSGGLPPSFPGSPARARFPGVLPRIWNVPALRNPSFTGREALLDDLAKALGSGRPAAVIQAISGLGGVGKTQLAVEYLYRHAPEYEVVWWVRAETQATLAADFAGLAVPLGLPEATLAEQAAVVEAVRRWLEGHGGWALIFDNAADPAAIRGYLPRGATGHTLLTSRRRDWSGTAGAIEVKTFERGESIQYLRGQLGELDEGIAGRLAADLGDLPLALAQAAAYVEESGLSPAAYLDLLRERRHEVLRRGLPADYPEPVATTWEISFRHLEEASPAAAALLHLCAYLAPDDIPLDLIAGGREHLPKTLAAVAGDPLALRDAVAATRRLSLLEVDGEALTVHRLVQAMLRERSKPQKRQLWSAAAVNLVAAAFPYRQYQIATWPGSARLLAHAIAATDHAQTLRVALESTSSLLNTAALYLQQRAEFDSALSLLHHALGIREAVLGPEDPSVAVITNNIGQILLEQGDLSGALDFTRRALAIDEAAYGPEHPNVAICANNIGQILLKQGDLSGALDCTRRALAIDEAAYGTENPNVARDTNNIGQILHKLGDLSRALAYTRRALAIDETAYGSEHPNVAIHANNIGKIVQEQGNPSEARPFFQRALRILESTYGPEHPRTRIVAGNLKALDRPAPDTEG